MTKIDRNVSQNFGANPICDREKLVLKLKMSPHMKIIIFEFFISIKYFLFIFSILGILDLAHQKNLVQANDHRMTAKYDG